MYGERDLSAITARCMQVTNSPYIRRQTPPELKNLRAVLEKASALAKEDVPALIAEVKRLRIRNRKLEAQLEAMGTAVREEE